MSRLKPDWFLTGMVLAVFVAWLFPGPGAEGGALHPALLSQIGVATIFFLHGLALSFHAMKQGTMLWKAHLGIQLTTFLVFPLLGLAFYKCTGGMVDPNLQMGFFLLCALPSTVSSSVAMTGTARGNVPVAVFNATLSSLLGIVLTPFWISFALHHGMHGGAPQNGGNIGATITNLCIWLLMPLLLGQMLSPSAVGNFARRHKKYIGKIDRLVILMLVYTSFCDSFVKHIWFGHATKGMAITIAAIVVMFFAVLMTMMFICEKLGVGTDLRAPIVFCATKKTLGSGIPMARLIFAGHPGLGMILLPIMLYHPLQLFVCGPLASHWARQRAHLPET